MATTTPRGQAILVDAAANSKEDTFPSFEKLVTQAAHSLRAWSLEGPPRNPRASFGALATDLESVKAKSMETVLELQSLRERYADSELTCKQLSAELAGSRNQNALDMRVLTKVAVGMAHRGAAVIFERQRTEAHQAAQREELESERSKSAALAEELAKLRQQHKALCCQVRESIPPVSVMCRVRPVFSYSGNAADRNTLAVDNPEITVEDAGARSRKFRVDRVLEGGVTQEDVFGVAAPWVESVLSGGAICLMAYGATGSGKTYTLHGSHAAKGGQISGIAQHALRRLIDGHGGGAVHVSILEVYLDQIRDLLATDASSPPTLQTSRRDKEGKMVLEREELQVDTFQRAEELLQQGYAARATEATMCNERSSRSHIVLTIRMPATGGQLVLVDLAGSENVHRSGADECGKLLAEAKSINKSLSALADVVEALAKKQAHVPYRNSRLTMLLEEILSQAKIMLLVHVSPFAADAPITSHSLQFAGRVRSVDFGQQMLRKDQEQRLKSEHQRSQEANRKLEAQADALRKELADVQRERNDQKAKLGQFSEQCREQQRELVKEKEIRAKLEAARPKEREQLSARVPVGPCTTVLRSGGGGKRGTPTPPSLNRSPRDAPLGVAASTQLLGPGGRPVFGDATNRFQAGNSDEIKDAKDAGGSPRKLTTGTRCTSSAPTLPRHTDEIFTDADEFQNVGDTPNVLSELDVESPAAADCPEGLQRSLFGGQDAEASAAAQLQGELSVKSILKKTSTNFGQRMRRRREQAEAGATVDAGKTVAFSEEREAASPPKWYYEFLQYDFKKELLELEAAQSQQEASASSVLQPVLQQQPVQSARSRVGSPRFPTMQAAPRMEDAAGERVRTPSPSGTGKALRRRTPTPTPTPAAGRLATLQRRREEQEVEKPLTRVAWSNPQKAAAPRWQS